MRIVTVLIVVFGLAYACGAKCGDISGNWQNELGSWMILSVDASNRISGEYYTAVEAKPGAAAYVSNITGLFSRQSNGSLFAFAVLFNHGSSLTSWVGQCMECDGKEVLYTTYNFRKYVPNHQEKWAAIAVNQNTFWRFEEETENTIGESTTARFSPSRTISAVTQDQPAGLGLKGKWNSISDGEDFEILGAKGDVLEGTASCSHPAGKHHTVDLIGRKDGTDIFTAVTLMSATSSEKIKSWTGYVYNTIKSVPQMLETSWLEHEFTPSCSLARNFVRFGTQNFTRLAAVPENVVKISETFMDKLRKFFSSMF